MPRKLFRLLLALAALAFVAGACTSSDDDDDAKEEDDTEEVDESTDDTEAEDEGTDDTEPEDEEEEEEPSDDSDAVELVENLGFSGDSAQCIVDSLDDQGIDVDGLDAGDVATPSSELTEALAQAGADCVSEITDGGLPEGSTDLSNPQVYDAFVEGFASTSGLGTETAECVADYFLDNDIDPASVLSEGGSDVVTDALAGCQ